MSKYVITLTKSEIEEAILKEVNHRVTINGRREFKDPKLSFRDSNGVLAYFEVDIEIADSTEEPDHEQ